MDSNSIDTHSPAAAAGEKKSWLKRLGWIGFLFFTIKGLIWLLIFWGAGEWLF